MAQGTPLDIIVVAGDVTSVNLTVNVSDGTAFNLAGYSAKWTVRPCNSSTPLITKTSGSGQITLSGNLISWVILATDTTNLQQGDYKLYEHEMKVYDSGGNPVTIVNNDQRISWGNFTVRKSITVS